MKKIDVLRESLRDSSPAADIASLKKCIPLINSIQKKLAESGGDIANLVGWVESLGTRSGPRKGSVLPVELDIFLDQELQAAAFWVTCRRWFIETVYAWPVVEDEEKTLPTIQAPKAVEPRVEATSRQAVPSSWPFMTAPFWEAKSGGPITEDIKRKLPLSEGKKKHDDTLDEIFSLQHNLFSLEYGEGQRGKGTPGWENRVARLRGQIAKLGGKPWPDPKRRHSPIDFSPSYERAVARIGGSDGEGNRWIGHGNMPRFILKR